MIALVDARPGYIDYEGFLAAASAQEPKVEIDRDDVAVLHFSSGSTGKIKAAMQTFGNRQASLRKFLAGSDVPVREGDRIAMLGPMTHATGMMIQPALSTAAGRWWSSTSSRSSPSSRRCRRNASPTSSWCRP